MLAANTADRVIEKASMDSQNKDKSALTALIQASSKIAIMLRLSAIFLDMPSYERADSKSQLFKYHQKEFY